MKGPESLGFENQHTDPGSIINEWSEGVGPTEGCCSYTGCREKTQEDKLMQEEMNVNFKGSKTTEKSDTGNIQAPIRSALRVNSMADDGQTALHAAVSKEHLEVVKNFLGGSSMSKMDTRGWTPKAQAEHRGNKSICDLLLSYENRKSDDHRMQFSGPEVGETTSHLKKAETNSYIRTSSSTGDGKGMEAVRKRVTIHMQFQNSSTHRQHGKLIILPDSIDELLKVAGKPFLDVRKELCDEPEIQKFVY